MKVLIVHNVYQQYGGEDTVVEMESKALIESGVDVVHYFKNNKSISSLKDKVFTFFNSIFSLSSYVNFRSVLKKEKPDLVHVHNFFPLISPSVFWACKHTGVPVVLTLHNYRIICPSATFYINGEVREDSVSSGPWWTIRNRVYKNSYIGTLSLSLMISINKVFGTWNVVSQFISLTNFSKEIFVKFGIDESKISVKPNYSKGDEGVTPDGIEDKVDRDKYFVFVGRLCKEKGIDKLLNHWKNLPYKLKVIGDGEIYKDLMEECPPGSFSQIEFLGSLDKPEVLKYIKGAEALVIPSVWYEGFPMVVLESYSVGTPVIANRIGSLNEVVEEDITGHKFEINDRDSLVKAIELVDINRNALSSNCRSYANKKYSEKRNVDQLLGIYLDLLNTKKCNDA